MPGCHKTCCKQGYGKCLTSASMPAAGSACRTVVEAAGRQHLRTEYFIRADEAPENYREATAGGQAACQRGSCAGSGGAADSTVGRQAGDSELAAAEAGASAAGQSPAVPAMLAEGLLPIGVTTYTQLLSDAELARIEAGAGVHRVPFQPDGCQPACPEGWHFQSVPVCPFAAVPTSRH